MVLGQKAPSFLREADWGGRPEEAATSVPSSWNTPDLLSHSEPKRNSPRDPGVGTRTQTRFKETGQLPAV